MSTHCTHCGAEVPPRSKFCLACGAPLAVAATSAIGGTDEAAPATTGSGQRSITRRFRRKELGLGDRSPWPPAAVAAAILVVGGLAFVGLRGLTGASRERGSEPVVAVRPGDPQIPTGVTASPPPQPRAQPPVSPVVTPPSPAPNLPRLPTAPVLSAPQPRQVVPEAPILAPGNFQPSAGPPLTALLPPIRPTAPPVAVAPSQPPPPAPVPAAPPPQPPRTQPPPMPNLPPPRDDIRWYLEWLRRAEFYRAWLYGQVVGLRLQMDATDVQRLLAALLDENSVANPSADIGFLRYKLATLEQARLAATRLQAETMRVRPPAACARLHQLFAQAVARMPQQIHLIQERQIMQAGGAGGAAIGREWLVNTLDRDLLEALRAADEELGRVTAAHGLSKDFALGAERSWMGIR